MQNIQTAHFVSVNASASRNFISFYLLIIHITNNAWIKPLLVNVNYAPKIFIQLGKLQVGHLNQREYIFGLNEDTG